MNMSRRSAMAKLGQLSLAAVPFGVLAATPQVAQASPAFVALATRAFASFLGGLAAKYSWYQVQTRWIDQRTQTAEMKAMCYTKYQCKLCICRVTGSKVVCS